MDRYAQALARMKGALPAAPHTNKMREKRIAANAHIKKTPAKKESWRRFWRLAQNSPGLKYLPKRRHRRALAKMWWKAGE